MKKPANETPALLIIDMVKDNFMDSRNLAITPFARATIEPLNKLIDVFRGQKWPIVFSTDAFHEDDLWLPKPRFSAFFNTGLANWLQERGVSLCAVGGISTHFCVLTTVLDAICHDFKSVLLEDCSAASSKQLHEQTLDNYRRNPLFPLLRVAKSTDLVSEFLGKF